MKYDYKIQFVSLTNPLELESQLKTEGEKGWKIVQIINNFAVFICEIPEIAQSAKKKK